MVGQSTPATVQATELTRKVLNLDVTFHWLGDDRLWYRRETPSGNEFVVVNTQTGAQSGASEAIARRADPLRPDCVVAPIGGKAIVRREHDLWLRYLFNGDEQRITSDGEAHFSYGDVDPSYDRQSVARRRADQPAPLLGVLWSPDSRFVVALRQDLRPYPERLFVTEYTSPDEGFAHTHFRRCPVAGDANAPDTVLVIFDTETRTLRHVLLDPQALNDLALHYFLAGIVWWRADSQQLFLVNANRGGSRYALSCIDVATGRAREILQEVAPFNVRLNPFDYARPNVHVTANGAEAIWYSEQSGHGHLYLHDALTGNVMRQLTQGEWVIFDLLKVDEEKRLIYFTASTREKAGNPYYRYLYRVGFDGGEPQLLTPEVADHRFNNLFFRGSFRYPADGADLPQPGSSLSPSGRYFVDSYSTVERPPEYVLRHSSGELIARLLAADASSLYRSGWRPPERVVTKAADGLTDLYGVITYPRDFDRARKYPVLDSMYPGPQGSFAPRAFVDLLVGGSIHNLQTFADAGFIVVALDARGTSHRARAFHDAFLGTEDVFGAADHMMAIRNLAADRPFMDLERVGVRGQSFGGYGALRAMLLHGEFFKVGVCATGPGEWLDMQGQLSIERFFGVPDSSESRGFYDLVSNTRLVGRLMGRVLLIYGGIDENVPLKHAFVLFDALIKADKDFDILIVPEGAHAVAREPYVIRRSVQYFLEHLARR